MLMLTRRVGESIIIGNDVVVTIIGCNGMQVKVGITAPKRISVHRQEIFMKILQEGKDFHTCCELEGEINKNED